MCTIFNRKRNVKENIIIVNYKKVLYINFLNIYIYILNLTNILNKNTVTRI